MNSLSRPPTKSSLSTQSSITIEAPLSRLKECFCLTIREGQGSRHPTASEIHKFHSRYLFSYAYSNPTFTLHCSARNEEGEYWLQVSADYNPMHLKRCALKWGPGTYRLSNPIDYMDELQRNEFVLHWILTCPEFLLTQFPSEETLLQRYVKTMGSKYRGSDMEFKILKTERNANSNTIKCLLKFDDASNDNPSYSPGRINNFLTIWGHRLHLRKVSIRHSDLRPDKVQLLYLDKLEHQSMGYERNDLKAEYIEGIYDLEKV